MSEGKTRIDIPSPVPDPEGALGEGTLGVRRWERAGTQRDDGAAATPTCTASGRPGASAPWWEAPSRWPLSWSSGRRRIPDGSSASGWGSPWEGPRSGPWEPGGWNGGGDAAGPSRWGASAWPWAGSSSGSTSPHPRWSSPPSSWVASSWAGPTSGSSRRWSRPPWPAPPRSRCARTTSRCTTSWDMRREPWGRPSRAFPWPPWDGASPFFPRAPGDGSSSSRPSPGSLSSPCTSRSPGPPGAPPPVPLRPPSHPRSAGTSTSSPPSSAWTHSPEGSWRPGSWSTGSRSATDPGRSPRPWSPR